MVSTSWRSNRKSPCDGFSFAASKSDRWTKKCRYRPTAPPPYKAGQANRKHTCTSERTHLEREREREGTDSRRQSVSVDDSKVGYCRHDRNVLTARSRFCRLVVLPQRLQRGHPVWRLHGKLPHHFTEGIQTHSNRFMRASNTPTGIQIF